MTAEAARILATTAAITAVGFLLGFRPHGSMLLFFAVPLVFGMAFATAVLAASFVLGRTALVESVSLFCSLSMFLSPGFVPLNAYPSWIQPLVEYQPMSCAITAMQALASGAPAGAALAKAAIWSVVIFAVAVTPAYRGLRRATQPR